MDYIDEPLKRIPVKQNVDVLVIGGGPSGMAAAVCAARSGVKVMLVEQSGSLGGMSTAGLMSHWTGNTQGGFYEEILERAFSYEREINFVNDLLPKQIINPETLKTVFLDLLYESGVILQLYTFACEAIMDGQKIKGAVIESKSGREAVLAEIVIDCSGDGDIAVKAGVPFNKGRETDGKMQPMTLMFKVAGVDTSRAVFPDCFECTIALPKGEIQALGRANIPHPAGHVLLYKTTLPGVVTCNMTNCIDLDGTKSEELTKAEYICRSQITPIVQFLREYVPGYEDCFIISSASTIGVRETRHLEGLYTLTSQDILEAKVFDDWAVTKAHFNFDVHNVNGAGLDENGTQKEFTQAKGYTIPYRCFVPMKVKHLLFAGRNISGTHLAHSNYRAMPICVNMGQAAGTAAALCVKNEISPGELNAAELQHALKQQGVSL